jgi:hypothetical protein
MSLSPHVPIDAPAQDLDLPRLLVAVAEGGQGLAAFTLFHFPERRYAALDVRQGSPEPCFVDAVTTKYGNAVSGVGLCGGSQPSAARERVQRA